MGGWVGWREGGQEAYYRLHYIGVALYIYIAYRYRYIYFYRRTIDIYIYRHEIIFAYEEAHAGKPFTQWSISLGEVGGYNQGISSVGSMYILTEIVGFEG